jgi:hypothetical protein
MGKTFKSKPTEIQPHMADMTETINPILYPSKWQHFFFWGGEGTVIIWDVCSPVHLVSKCTSGGFESVLGTV